MVSRRVSFFIRFVSALCHTGCCFILVNDQPNRQSVVHFSVSFTSICTEKKLALTVLAAEAGRKAAPLSVQFVGFLHKAVHPTAVQQPADAEQTKGTEIENAPDISPQIEVVRANQT